MSDSARKVEKVLPVIAATLEDYLRASTGEHLAFALIVFTEQRVQYVSNGPRPAIADAMTNLLSRWRANPGADHPHSIAVVEQDPFEYVETPEGRKLWSEIKAALDAQKPDAL